MITSPTPWSSVQTPDGKHVAILDRVGVCIATFLNHRDADLMLAMVNSTSIIHQSEVELAQAEIRVKRKMGAI